MTFNVEEAVQDGLDAVAPNLSDAAFTAWIPVITAAFQAHGYTTRRSVAAALGQMAVESAGFSALTENLNYSAQGLRTTFGSHFPKHDEAAYARQPEKIANRVYANRMGNGDESSGDGWRFRGGGLIQTTGRENYARLAASYKMALDDCVGWVRTPAGAIESACWFLDTKGFLVLANQWKITAISVAVNGGTNGLKERIKASEDALRAIP